MRDVCSNYGSLCADSEGRVFGGCFGYVVILEISETGNLTYSGSLTAGGRLDWRQNTVAVSSTPGQLWIGCSFILGRSCDIYLIDIDNDTVIQKKYSNGCPNGYVSQLLTGELLIGRYDIRLKEVTVRLYQSDITFPPTDLTVTRYPRLSHNDHFLVVDRQANTILILDNQGDLVYTVDDLNGKHGIWMKISDVAVWEKNLLVCDAYGNLMILSML